MIRSILLVAAIVSLAEGAALVRFINTVPTRTNQQSVSLNSPVAGNQAATTTAAPTARTLTNAQGSIQGQSDRVGLQYFAQSADGTTVAAPTIVWTTVLSNADITALSPTSPYAWYYAMPALRAYHTVYTTAGPVAETTAVDKPYGARNTADNNNQDPSLYDNYEQSRLRADGVGLYLSFAAGTYRMQAYAAIAGDDTTATRNAAVARPFQDSSTQFTLADGAVYTIIAYGAGQFGASVPLSGNTVRLTLLQETTDPVTFGMGSIRFFNGFAASGVAVDVYSGTGVSDSTRIASAIPVGGVSGYIDVAPGIQKEFPVAQTGSTANYLASSTAVQRDVRAGSRTTIICAINNEQTSSGFCRGIPSRVVAYVRLINDLTAQDSLVQGAFGAQKLSQTRINLWASYEVPRPEILAEGSQITGTNKVTGHPVTQEGLYPVVVNVAPGTVTGYSEVYVPVYIMDLAVRRQMAALDTFAAITNDLAYTQGGYIFAPIYKRVHYVIKTDGYATLSARQLAGAGTDALVYEYPVVSTAAGQMKLNEAPSAANDPRLYTPSSAVTVDEYVEPGEYYSIFASAGNLAAANVATTTTYAYPRSDLFTVYYRRDRTVDMISSGITSGKGSINLISFPFQTWTATTLNFQLASTTTTAAMASFAANTMVAASATGPVTYLATTGNELQLPAGAYTYSTSGGTDCYTTMPTSVSSINIADQGIYDIFVLNTLGCVVNGPSVSRLNFVVQQRAAVTGSTNAPSRRRHAVAAF